jgi:hypothetical protein
MDPNSKDPGPSPAYDLVFVPFHLGRCYAFPCSATGVVDLDMLTEPARSNYLMVRALVRHDFRWPTIVRRV